MQPHLRPDCDKILNLAAIHKRVLKFFPEEYSPDNYENILLKTIKLPKNLMYVTEQLPGSTYDYQDSLKDGESMRLPNTNKIKRNTTDAYMEKVFQRGKKNASQERGMKDGYLALHKSD